MACEHRQNLPVEPLHGAANSALSISQRPFDVVKIARDILALDLSPPIGDLDDPRLQIRKHRRYGRQFGGIARRVGLLRSHGWVLSDSLLQTGPGRGCAHRTGEPPAASQVETRPVAEKVCTIATHAPLAALIEATGRKKRASASRRRRSLGDTGRRIPELVTILSGGGTRQPEHRGNPGRGAKHRLGIGHQTLTPSGIIKHLRLALSSVPVTSEFVAKSRLWVIDVASAADDANYQNELDHMTVGQIATTGGGAAELVDPRRERRRRRPRSRRSAPLPYRDLWQVRCPLPAARSTARDSGLHGC